MFLLSLSICLFLHVQNRGSGCDLIHCDESRCKMHKVPCEPQREDVLPERLVSGQHVCLTLPEPSGHV